MSSYTSNRDWLRGKTQCATSTIATMHESASNHPKAADATTMTPLTGTTAAAEHLGLLDQKGDDRQAANALNQRRAGTAQGTGSGATA